jgi:hypothetical protein
MIDWIVEVSWGKTETPDLVLNLVLSQLLNVLEEHCPILLNRTESRFTIAIYVEAERPSDAVDAADELLKHAFALCRLTWPAARHKICDIVDPDDDKRFVKQAFDGITDRLIEDGFNPSI